MEKELNKLLEGFLIGIVQMLKTILSGIFRGMRKLNCVRNIAVLFVTMLISAGIFILFRDRGFHLPIPDFVNGILYYVLLFVPFFYLFVLGSVGETGKKDFDMAFAEIDFKGRDGKYPHFCGSEKKDKKLIYLFRSNIPVDEWKNRKNLLETAFDCTILRIENGSSKKVVRVTTLPSDFRIPEKINWDDALIKQDSGVITVGKSAQEEITFDLNRVPHVLAAGETGSGKSVILRLILWQFINQGSRVYMLDFKGGVEFGIDYERYGEVVTERTRALEILTVLEEENTKRLALFRQMRVKNIVEYNRKTGQNLCRIGVFCDELAEMMDKKGAAKELKEQMEKIEGKISTLARLSRATGINLILGMQRPDANVLTGQIKNNIPVRISGRFADKTASEIVLGSTDACNIPDIKGRFIYKMGNEMQQFQAYYFDDETMLKDVEVEVGDMLADTPLFNPTEFARPETPKPETVGRKKKTGETGTYKTPAGRKKSIQKETVKEAADSIGDMKLGEWEARKEAMDEYDLNLDFFS